VKRSQAPARRVPLKAGGTPAGQAPLPPRRVPLRSGPARSLLLPDGSRRTAAPGGAVAP
jgi:hypothetical protein